MQSYGAIILGHADPAVVDAVTEAARGGTSYGAPTEREVRLAEAICARVPSIDQVRLVSSGTEATMTAVRLARGHTGRDRLVKFAGNYHGHADTLLAAAGSGVATLGLPGSAGVPEGAVADTVVAPYNAVPDLDESVAAVIVEPVAANMGLVAPAPGFLAGLRDACDAAGALLVFDEVITGFRLGPGGAQERYGVMPDLTRWARSSAAGCPSAPSAAAPTSWPIWRPSDRCTRRARCRGIRSPPRPGWPRWTGSTTMSSPTSTARAERLRGWSRPSAVPAWPSGPAVGRCSGCSSAATPAVDYDSALATDTARYARLFHALFAGGSPWRRVPSRSASSAWPTPTPTSTTSSTPPAKPLKRPFDHSWP